MNKITHFSWLTDVYFKCKKLTGVEKGIRFEIIALLGLEDHTWLNFIAI